MNGYTDEELKELEEMIALEELIEKEREEARAALDFYIQPHTDEEWKEHAKKEMLESGCPEEDLEKYFYYDSEAHEYVHNKEGETYSDNFSRLEEMRENMFRQAISWGMPNAFPGNPFQNQEEEYVDTDLSRLQTLRKNGLSASPSNFGLASYIDTSYTIDGIKHDGCVILYHGNDEIGVFYDDCGEFSESVPHGRCVEELLKIVAKHNIPLLLIYWENGGTPTWEVYLDGKFVRQQYTVYSYDGYVYDRKKMSRMAELKDADIGSKQKALMELNAEARKTVYNQFEQDIRIAENEREHAELAEIVTKMQQKYEQLGFVFSQVTTTDDGLDEVSHRSVCDALDSFADTITPGLAAAAYEEKAKTIYPFYSNVAPSSQRFLRTAVALEEHLTEEHYDICPLYFELCRVFENELDIRIFSEYTNELLNRKEFKAEDGDYEETCYRIILDAVTKARREKKRKAKEKKDIIANKTAIRVFVPEKMKVISLYMVEADIGMESVCQTTLLKFLKEKRYKLEYFADKENFDAACKYVENRNRYTHPDDKSDAADLQKELQSIKEQTTARMEWLIEATQGQE